MPSFLWQQDTARHFSLVASCSKIICNSVTKGRALISCIRTKEELVHHIPKSW
jgi:hypothetical protein